MTSLRPKTLLAALALSASGLALADSTLLNVSYDVAREFYKDYNAAFIAHYKKAKGQDIRIDQSHAGSSAQARAVNDGLAADVVTMNTSTDVQFLADNGVVAKDWARRFPHDAAPTTSTMLFLVRHGNPKGIEDWDDLIKPGVQVIVVNPKTGGNGRYAYLAAWGAVLDKGGSAAQAAEFVGKLYRNVPVLAKGGRDATATFLQRNQGDVLITFESEVLAIDREFGAGKVDVVYPSVSVVAENPVAVVERTVARKGTAELAKAYLDYLYSDEAQEIAARHAIRPRSEAVLKKYARTFKPIRLFTVAQYFGSLTEAQKVHFNDGGQFDKLYMPGKP
ncbi:sulfate ABC transporter substrate-binding protein [Verminephrobacter eiseniae]|uniref:sulfate ABC transporter substrate-binding protein n=1 Tax=Verminephrobacter eiseniae TaxID=364317 RepID=UPI0010E927B9|nr:sulfate ABC transporter substrate-binding protein [Verminephrobacter eiseniae]KAB7585133.1 sulfate ABC transporter substrate-binding protein [Verminephrobacter sp. Larva24]MCW5233721.1 sulfate ABC transporter substrate-binding protein [Verminephrobacter eiseniae]MCW5294725.1 sulfate ABC transporter substrate-binding protein [Verminephrobacter eiseniae]MCW8185539.1 sulfate ABC transporter substrate-binding protein [Verminephrobacter eiseniae]MCW8224189.1 sulfate ABC transporter substrate-bin